MDIEAALAARRQADIQEARTSPKEKQRAKQQQGQNNYRLVLPEATSWQPKPDASSLRGSDGMILPIGNKTGIQPLAKAIAVRAKDLAEGSFFAIETSLLGSQETQRFRVSKLAHAIAR